MKNKLYLLAALCFFGVNLFSQKSNIDSVFLKNGNLLVGQIVSYVPDDNLKIQTSNAVFYFALQDVLKICPHSIEFNAKGFDIYSQAAAFQEEKEKAVSDSIATRRKEVKNYLKAVELPPNLFLFEYGIDGFELLQKFQITYIHKTGKDRAFGVGYAYRIFEAYNYFDNLFVDIRRYHTTRANNFSSLALDLGLASNREQGLSNGYLFANPTYVYGLRLDKYFYLTCGFDVNIMFNGSGSMVTLGLKAGFMI